MTIACTERLRLRELQHADDAFILELVNDPAWLRFIGDRNVHSLEDARGYIDRLRTSSERLADSELLGLCGILQRETLDAGRVQAGGTAGGGHSGVAGSGAAVDGRPAGQGRQTGSGSRLARLSAGNDRNRAKTGQTEAQ